MVRLVREDIAGAAGGRFAGEKQVTVPLLAAVELCRAGAIKMYYRRHDRRSW